MKNPKYTYHERYHYSPLVLEPEDWTPGEWETILKLFGMLEAERIEVYGYTLETYGIEKPRYFDSEYYRIWARFYDEDGTFRGSSVSTKFYKREGNAIRAAEKLYNDMQPDNVEWAVAREYPWTAIDKARKPRYPGKG